MKKMVSLLLAATMAMGLLSGCGNSNQTGDNTPTNQDNVLSDGSGNSGGNSGSEVTPPSDEAVDTQFILEYPEGMAAQGYETLVLDEMPTRIVCTVTASVITMYEMGASLVGMPSSAATKGIAAENPDITVLPSIMSDEFNIETVVALHPDLVIVNSMYADSHGATLEALGIPVYYIGAGHGVGYEAVKEESLLFINAFSVDEESTAKGDALKQKFEEIEQICATLQETYQDTKVMVFQLGGVDMVYGQTSAGTLGSMLDMLGFDNVSDATAASSMFQIDYETTLVEQPELLVVCGSGSAEDTVSLMDEVVASNPDYWNAMTAITEDQVLCLGVEYIAVYGIGYVDALASLAEDVAAFYAE